MGGKAFSHGDPPLSTPRMPTAIYEVLRDKYIALLSTLYTEVASPVDAPGKDTHGDVDILVCGPKSSKTSPEALTQILCAVRRIRSGPTTSYAVPYPDSPEDYVQLDIHICQPSVFQWTYFTNSHGDLWNLLGTSIRPFGLTANDVAFYLRIKDIDKIDKKKSLVHLTSDPVRVLEFLDLDSERYFRPFGSTDELYAYATSMRFFRRDTYIREDLKANDRKRMKQRPVYSKFVDEWLPRHPHLGIANEANPMTRATALEEALAIFNKRREYEDTIERWRRHAALIQDKQVGNRQRRHGVVEEIEYADAWMNALRHGSVQVKVGSG